MAGTIMAESGLEQGGLLRVSQRDMLITCYDVARTKKFMSKNVLIIHQDLQPYENEIMPNYGICYF